MTLECGAVFSWIIHPSRAKRMIYGGFEMMVDL